jgi:hypothetical protein
MEVKICLLALKQISYRFFFKNTFLFSLFNIKQLLDEAEHDIKNYSDRGQCYLPDNIDRGG